MDGRIAPSNRGLPVDQSVLQPLVIALLVEVRHVLRDRSTQGTLADEYHLP
jgi:hypothetical protein